MLVDAHRCLVPVAGEDVDFPKQQAPVRSPAGNCKCCPVRPKLIADGHKDNGFIHLTARIGAGRTQDVKHAAGEAIFSSLTKALDQIFVTRPIGISFEIVEINKDLSWKKNTLHDAIKARAEETAA